MLQGSDSILMNRKEIWEKGTKRLEKGGGGGEEKRDRNDDGKGTQEKGGKGTKVYKRIHPDISMGSMFLSVVTATTETNSSNMRQNITMISRKRQTHADYLKKQLYLAEGWAKVEGTPGTGGHGYLHQ